MATKSGIDREVFKAWVARNPLRAWRNAQDPTMSMMEAATRIGASMSSVQQWESGVALPSATHFAGIATLVGPQVLREWGLWFNERLTL